MYSVLMMAALTTGGDAANCHRHGDCHGCYGGCYGSCYGSCYGWYNGACYGSCYGCYGCHGFAYSCSGCWGGCYGAGWGACQGCSGCYGCGGYAPSYAPIYGPGTEIVPNAPLMPPAKTDVLPAPKPTTPGASATNRARLIVELPADAKLYIDDQLMKTSSETRSFNTPVLTRGQTYFYELRAEVIRDGQPVTVTKRVTLKAGEVVQARFGEMEAASTVSTLKVR